MTSAGVPGRECGQREGVAVSHVWMLVESLCGQLRGYAEAKCVFSSVDEAILTSCSATTLWNPTCGSRHTELRVKLGPGSGLARSFYFAEFRW
jgi:hypothetical protein